jgi:hypothetical protein
MQNPLSLVTEPLTLDNCAALPAVIHHFVATENMATHKYECKLYFLVSQNT